ncbi:MAG: hypothetical protein ABIK93_04520 [candidate division WOR-3 bacterium]
MACNSALDLVKGQIRESPREKLIRTKSAMRVIKLTEEIDRSDAIIGQLAFLLIRKL